MIQYFKKYNNDIRFWIILFFVIRLFGITNPPLEVAHNWRQCDMAMVSKNMSCDVSSLLYPKVDYGGTTPQVMGMEFPLMNYLIAIANKCFGYAHWYGRLLNLIVSSFGIWLFFLFIKKISNQQHAFYASLVLLFSLWFAYSRKIMPDTFSASLCMFGCYFATLYFENNKKTVLNIIAAFVFICLSILTKISSIILLAFLVPVLVHNVKSKAKIITLTGIISLSAAIVYYWYFVWVPYLNTLSDVRFFMGKPLEIALEEIVQHWDGLLLRFYETALGYLGFGICLIGLYLLIKNKSSLLLIAVFAGAALMLIMLKSGKQFSIHSYYIIPFVPVMAMIAGYVFTFVKPKFAFILLCILFLENSARLYGEFIIKPRFKKFETLATKLDSLGVKRTDAIAVNSSVNPTPLYFSGRCGWTPGNDQLSSVDFVRNLKAKKCSYIVIDKKVFGSDVQVPIGKEIFNDDNFRIYKLTD